MKTARRIGSENLWIVTVELPGIGAWSWVTFFASLNEVGKR